MSEKPMRLVAAIDDSPVAPSVLGTALAFADLLHLALDVVHVDVAGPVAEDAARAAGVQLRLLEGDPAAVVVAEAGADDVVMTVVGARRHGANERPAGHVAEAVMRQVSKPLLVVSPHSRVPNVGRLGRILVPLDGTELSAMSVRRAVAMFADSGLDVVAVHVFDRGTVPAFWDQPQHAADSWTREFLARYCNQRGTRLRIGTGPAAESIVRAADAEDVDAIVLAWSQSLSAGRARVILHALRVARVPLLLLPVPTLPVDSAAVAATMAT